MLEKTNLSNVYRDPNSGALINRDSSKLAAYRLKKQRAREDKEKLSAFDKLANEVKQLKVEMNNLTQIIKTIQERSN